MISFEEAYATVMGHVRVLLSETVPLTESLGRVLAQEVVADRDFPPFNKAAMDGYACYQSDLPGTLRVVETIPAGKMPTRKLRAGECAKIMTGAMVPDGADCVIMAEHTVEKEAGTIYCTRQSRQINICNKGEEAKSGERVLTPGCVIKPQHIAIMASVGCTHPQVSRRPRVAVVATGNELVEPSHSPSPVQIRNSNALQLCAQIVQAGALPKYYGIAPDEESGLDRIIKQAFQENDVCLFSGGVSVGEYDLVPRLLQSNGIDLLFRKIAIKPGKPTTFGVGPSIYCFGLPGNPVSSFLLMELLVKPFLLALMGCTYIPLCCRAPLESEYKRSSDDRDQWVPGWLTDDGKIRRVPFMGSAHIMALATVTGFFLIPKGVASLTADETVVFRFI